MANVKTFNLTIYFIGTELTFRGISRVAVNRYIKHYEKDVFYTGKHVYIGNHVEAR